MVLKVLIVDDNPGARALVRSCLEGLEGIEVVAEAASGEEALVQAGAHVPDVVILDVDMPDMGGIEVARHLNELLPSVYLVFVTAYPEYALEAFEVYSYDYIVKPIDEDRVRKTLLRIKQRARAEDREINELVRVLNRPNRLSIKNGHEIVFIEVEKIVCMEKDKKKTVIYTVDNKYYTNEPLTSIERRLNNQSFFRSHKSYVINLQMIERIIPWTNGTYLVKFRYTNNDALLSRAQAKVLPEVF
ncbi:MAG: response regulator transcription factor [Clostridia bacterium]|nr:MAG: response regulator transcription factor [Clostridia bacterium]